MNELTTGRLLAETWHATRRGFWPFLAIAFLVHLPYFATWLGLFAAGSIGSTAETLLGLADGAILGPITSAALVYGVFELLRGGRRVQVGPCLRVGLRRWLPVLVASVLVGLAVLGGMCLLLIPGIIAFVGLAVTVPALVAEKLGVSDSLRRSWRLTEGYRLRVFFLYLALFGVVFGLYILLAQLVAPELLTGSFATDASPARLLAVRSFGFAFALVFGVLQSVASVVTYHELRRVKEGIGSEELAAAFD